MQPGYYYLTTWDGHRSILGLSETRDVQADWVLEPITDAAVLAYLAG